MFRLLQYFGKFQSAKGALTGLPGWAKGIVFILAVPGLILILLSIAAFLVSMLALFLLTIPAYRCLRWITGASNSTTREQFVPADDFADAMQQFVQMNAQQANESAAQHGTEPFTTVSTVAVSSQTVALVATESTGSHRSVATVVTESTGSAEETIRPAGRRQIEVRIVE